VCDLETSRMGAPYIYDISHLRVNYATSHEGIRRHSGAAPQILYFGTRYSLAVSFITHPLYSWRKSRSYSFSTGCTGCRARVAFWIGGRYLCPNGDRTPILDLVLCSLIIRTGANTTRWHFVKHGNTVNSKLMSIRCCIKIIIIIIIIFIILRIWFLSDLSSPFLPYVLTSNEKSSSLRL